MAALIVVLYWGTARFEEAAALILENVHKRGLTFRVVVKKGKMNQVKQPRPVKVLTRYILVLKSISGHTQFVTFILACLH